MKKFTMTTKRLFLITFCFLGLTALKAQQSTTLYFMDAVPQANHMNPATQYRCGFQMSILPVFSSFSLKLELPVSFADLFYYDEADNTTYFFLNSDAKTDNFISKLKKQNYFSSEMNYNIASLGFRVSDLYLTFDINARNFSRFSLPADFFAIPVQGKSGSNEIQFKDFGFDYRGYTELALGASRKFSDALTLGARAKLLFGSVDISSKNKDLSIETGPLSWTVNTDLTFRGSIPFSDYHINDEGTLDSISFNTDEINVSSLLNKGIGLDLGAHYKLSNKLILSASLLDFGYIRWKQNTVNLTTKGSFVYEGFDADSLQSDTYASSMLDSLQGVFKINATEDPYTTYLNSKIYLGARYYLTPRVNVGVLSRTELYKRRLREQISLSLNLTPIKLFALSFSYSLLNGTHNNIGVGWNVKLGPVNSYMIFDNIPLVFAKEVNTGAPIPTHFKEFSFRFGMHLIFGCKSQQKKITKDKPLL